MDTDISQFSGGKSVKTNIASFGVLLAVLVSGLGQIETAHAGAREQALKIYNRVAGVPPSDNELSQMTTLIESGDYKRAVKIATSSYHFYNTNLVRWAHSLSNARGDEPSQGWREPHGAAQ